MKITIDTKEDSHEEIRKVIGMLQNLVGQQKIYSNQKNIFEDSDRDILEDNKQQSSEQPSGNVFGNLFGENNQQEQPEQPSEEEKEETPEIIPYDI